MVSLNDQEKSAPNMDVTGGTKEVTWFQKYLTILTDFLPMRKAVFTPAAFCALGRSVGLVIAPSGRQNGGLT